MFFFCILEERLVTKTHRKPWRLLGETTHRKTNEIKDNERRNEHRAHVSSQEKMESPWVTRNNLVSSLSLSLPPSNHTQKGHARSYALCLCRSLVFWPEQENHYYFSPHFRSLFPNVRIRVLHNPSIYFGAKPRTDVETLLLYDHFFFIRPEQQKVINIDCQYHSLATIDAQVILRRLKTSLFQVICEKICKQFWSLSKTTQ